MYITKLNSQIIKFVVAGTLSFAVDIFVFFVLMLINKEFYVIKSIISFLAGSIINYLFSIGWVFDNNKYSFSIQEFINFLFFTLLGLVVSLITLIYSAEVLKTSYIVSKMISVISATFFNYYTKKNIVFRKRY